MLSRHSSSKSDKPYKRLLGVGWHIACIITDYHFSCKFLGFNMFCHISYRLGWLNFYCILWVQVLALEGFQLKFLISSLQSSNLIASVKLINFLYKFITPVNNKLINQCTIHDWECIWHDSLICQLSKNIIKYSRWLNRSALGGKLMFSLNGITFKP